MDPEDNSPLSLASTASGSDCPPLTIAHIYDMASDISEHFKQLMENNVLTDDDPLITTVVSALIHLEQVYNARDVCLARVDELQDKIVDLERDIKEKGEQQHRFLRELEEADELWRKENLQLSQMVKLLKTENEKLASNSGKASHSLNGT